MKKFNVHIGYRITKDYVVFAKDEAEAEEKAERLAEREENFNTWDFASMDADCWEEK